MENQTVSNSKQDQPKSTLHPTLETSSKMEFRFDVNPYFKSNIIKVNSNLLPIGFNGDRRTLLDTTSKMSEIINELGEASARAQGLNKPVTTAQKLRNSDQVIYLLSENLGQNGSVTGLLKVGKKNLYVFDQNGETVQVNAPCVLDFYVHESRQRSGLGKKLFESMLTEENVKPEKLAIDRPSDKLVGFLKKHYGLQRTIPQANNFVVYDGFFGNNNGDNHSASLAGNHNLVDNHNKMHITASPNTALFGPHFVTDEHKKRIRSQQNSPSLPVVHTQPMGRFGAPRPMCSMAEIIHSSPQQISNEPNSFLTHIDHNGHHNYNELIDASGHHHLFNDEIKVEIDEQQIDPIIDNNDIVNDDNLVENLKNLEIIVEPELNHTKSSTILQRHEHQQQQIEHQPIDELKFEREHIEEIHHNHRRHYHAQPPATLFASAKKSNHFHHTKQHTGLKNISFNVLGAVSPTDKMEFDQMNPESFGVLKINRPIGMPHHSIADINNSGPHTNVSNGSVEGFTDQGYFDLKFHHNRLW